MSADATWLQAAAMDSRGNLVPNLANVLICLRGDMKLNGCFGFNEMTGTVELIEELPTTPNVNNASSGKLPRAVIDADVTQVCELLQRAYDMRKIGLTIVHQAVDRRGRECRFHPLRDSLNDLIWDRVPRVHSLFSTYFGAEVSDYTKEVSQIFTVGMVARVYKPGCQADYVPILVGPQGLLKSTALATLTGQEYFGDHLPDIRNKDVSQYLRGKWLIELGELSVLNKTDIESMKAFITRREEKYRPPYGRLDVSEPRQCVFAGSTNRDKFLRDTTGNRRFLPVPTPKIDIEALKRDRAMILAEAVDMFRKGTHWWPDRDFERKHFVPRQEERVEIDDWEQPIKEWLEIGPTYSATSFEIMNKALGIITANINPAHGRRVADIMRKLGWEQNKKNSKRPYVRPGRNPGEYFDDEYVDDERR